MSAGGKNAFDLMMEMSQKVDQAEEAYVAAQKEEEETIKRFEERKCTLVDLENAVEKKRAASETYLTLVAEAEKLLADLRGGGQ